MHLLYYLITTCITIATKLNLSPTITIIPCPYNKNSLMQSHPITPFYTNPQPSDIQTTEDKPPNDLENILKKDTHSEGVIQSILGGLALCYNVLANLLLYPIFSFLLVLLSAGAILILAIWINKVKNEKPISTTWILFTALYALLYLDLFLVLYHKKEILFLFIELQKDLFLTIVSASLGYIVGKFFSSKVFEEKQLP